MFINSMTSEIVLIMTAKHLVLSFMLIMLLSTKQTIESPSVCVCVHVFMYLPSCDIQERNCACTVLSLYLLLSNLSFNSQIIFG